MTRKGEPVLQVPERKHKPVRGPDLKRNQETLAEHRKRLRESGFTPLTPDEEEKMFPGDRGYV